MEIYSPSEGKKFLYYQFVRIAIVYRAYMYNYLLVEMRIRQVPQITDRVCPITERIEEEGV